jgi:hypothetical protein
VGPSRTVGEHKERQRERARRDDDDKSQRETDSDPHHSPFLCSDRGAEFARKVPRTSGSQGDETTQHRCGDSADDHWCFGAEPGRAQHDPE